MVRLEGPAEAGHDVAGDLLRIVCSADGSGHPPELLTERLGFLPGGIPPGHQVDERVGAVDQLTGCRRNCDAVVDSRRARGSCVSGLVQVKHQQEWCLSLKGRQRGVHHDDRRFSLGKEGSQAGSVTRSLDRVAGGAQGINDQLQPRAVGISYDGSTWQKHAIRRISRHKNPFRPD